MLLLTATALAGAPNLQGWPCSRMNWAWRNVWSTCSINSYVPTNAAAEDFPPAHWRKAPLRATGGVAGDTVGPTNFLDATGIVSPAVAGSTAAAVPQMFCDALTNTNQVTTGMAPHSQSFSLLRNRCRRAIDAYGGIVRTCSAAPNANLVGNRGPGATVFPDFAPAPAHVPHVNNVKLLSLHSQHCFVNSNPTVLHRSPAATCPGLLGWFTVVWTACSIGTFGPNIVASPTAAQAGLGTHIPGIIPLGDVVNAGFGLNGMVVGPNSATAPEFFFCSPVAGVATPAKWNERGAAFRTSRCRRALDQFGRTANRCGGSDFAVQGPVAGSSDPLRFLFTGKDAASAPRGLARLAPLCN